MLIVEPSTQPDPNLVIGSYTCPRNPEREIVPYKVHRYCRDGEDSFEHDIDAGDTGIGLLIKELFALRARVKRLEANAHTL